VRIYVQTDFVIIRESGFGLSLCLLLLMNRRRANFPAFTRFRERRSRASPTGTAGSTTVPFPVDLTSSFPQAGDGAFMRAALPNRTGQVVENPEAVSAKFLFRYPKSRGRFSVQLRKLYGRGGTSECRFTFGKPPGEFGDSAVRPPAKFDGTRDRVELCLMLLLLEKPSRYHGIADFMPHFSNSGG